MHIIPYSEAMGRKGGGRSGFVKAARSAAHVEDDDEQQTSSQAAEQTQPAPSAAQPAPSKAAKFLKTEEPAEAGSSSDEEGEPGVETRGKMLQRHKRVSNGGGGRLAAGGSSGVPRGALALLLLPICVQHLPGIPNCLCSKLCRFQTIWG